MVNDTKNKFYFHCKFMQARRHQAEIIKCEIGFAWYASILAYSRLSQDAITPQMLEGSTEKQLNHFDFSKKQVCQLMKN